MATERKRHTPQKKTPSKIQVGPQIFRGGLGREEKEKWNRGPRPDEVREVERMAVVAKWVMELLDLKYVSCIAKRTLPEPRRRVGDRAFLLKSAEWKETSWQQNPHKKTLSKIRVRSNTLRRPGAAGCRKVANPGRRSPVCTREDRGCCSVGHGSDRSHICFLQCEKNLLRHPKKEEGIGSFCSSLPNGEQHHGNKTKKPHATKKDSK